MMQHNTRTKIINILNNEIPVFQINAFLFYVNEYKKEKKKIFGAVLPPSPHSILPWQRDI